MRIQRAVNAVCQSKCPLHWTYLLKWTGKTFILVKTFVPTSLLPLISGSFEDQTPQFGPKSISASSVELTLEHYLLTPPAVVGVQTFSSTINSLCGLTIPALSRMWSRRGRDFMEYSSVFWMRRPVG